jgi:serine phosphatase RsbU (regulator of sigma subunit)
LTNIKRISLSVILCVYCFTALSAQTGKTGQPKDEKAAKIKTAFIYNFTKYVFWPHEDEMKAFTICVMSSKLLAQQLEEMEKIARFRDRLPIKVVYCKTTDDIQPCQMIIVDGLSDTNLWSVYSKIRGKSVLMVAENLLDYKKSMISFTESNNKMKYIINKTKMDESNLVVKKLLYDLAITKEGEWHSLIEKLRSLLSSKDSEVKVEKNELEQMLNMYRTLEKEKDNKDLTINQLEDSMRARIQRLKEKEEEYQYISREIEKHRLALYDQQRKLSNQKKLLFSQDSKITRQRNVIMLIGVLTSFVLLLLLFAIRSNNQRKKANALLSQRKTEIEKQKQLVDEKQKEILDSIKYAKRIQKALMANDKLMRENLQEYFIFFRPKDIVAGDFYWATRLPDSTFIYVTADSTGHGVPGAFMSLLNITKLNDAVKQKHITRPDLILNDVRENIIAALNPPGIVEESKDGMDAILCRLDLQNMKLQYAAANSNFCIIRSREIINLKADKMPVGKSNDNTPFTLNEIDLEKGDMIYTFSDGYADQFGGPKGKKFKHRILKEIFLKISELSPETQKIMLERQLEDWMGHLEQVDDVLVIGVRV